MNDTLVDLAEKVSAHARENYSRGGWDYVVECWEREDIIDILSEEPATRTLADAISRVANIVEIFEERRFEAQALSGELEYYGIEEVDGELRRKTDR